MNVIPEEKEKDLLSQIDEFRQRAELLEGKMQAREAKATELDQLVIKKQERAEELDKLIEERTRHADVFTKVVRKEMDTVSGQFTVQLNDLKDALNAALEENRANQEKALEQLSIEVSEKMDNLESTTGALPARIHAESVQVYRNTQELMKELDTHVGDVEKAVVKTKKRSGMNVAILVICILNLLGVAAAALFLTGILPF